MSAASRAALDRDMRDERMKECAGEMFEALKEIAEASHRRQLPITSEINDLATAVIAKVERP